MIITIDFGFQKTKRILKMAVHRSAQNGFTEVRLFAYLFLRMFTTVVFIT